MTDEGKRHIRFSGYLALLLKHEFLLLRLNNLSINKLFNLKTRIQP